jgi:hypothetical protein
MLSYCRGGEAMRKVLMLMLGCLCTGCVYLDQTMLDTAEPLKSGKPEFQFYTGSGIDLDSAVKIPYVDYNPDTDLTPDDAITGGGVTGFKLALGLGSDYEIGIRTWSGEGQGYKLNLKKRFYNRDSLSLAINPNVFYLFKGNSDNEGKREIRGWQLPVMATVRVHKTVAFTLQLQVERDYYYRDVYNDQLLDFKTYGPYHIDHAGIIGGLNLKFNVISLYGELGIERIQGINTRTTYRDINGAGIGLEF